MIFVPLNALAVADLDKSRIPAATGLLNLVRWVGSSVGIAVAATILGNIEKRFEYVIGNSMAANNPMQQWTLEQITHRVESEGIPSKISDAYAYMLLNDNFIGVAKSLAFERIFTLFGMALIFVLPLLFLMRKRPDAQAAAPAGH